jgi:hypothetical protein
VYSFTKVSPVYRYWPVSASAVADVAPKHTHAIQAFAAAAAAAVVIVTPSALPRADPNPMEARRQRGVEEGFFATLSESAASKCLMLGQVVRWQFTLRFTWKLQAKECGRIRIQSAGLSRRWLSPSAPVMCHGRVTRFQRKGISKM